MYSNLEMEIREIIEAELPECFEIAGIELGWGGIWAAGETAVLEVKLARLDGEEPHGWAHRITTRVRERWGPGEFTLSFLHVDP